MQLQSAAFGAGVTGRQGSSTDKVGMCGERSRGSIRMTRRRSSAAKKKRPRVCMCVCAMRCRMISPDGFGMYTGFSIWGFGFVWGRMEICLLCGCSYGNSEMEFVGIRVLVNLYTFVLHFRREGNHLVRNTCRWPLEMINRHHNRSISPFGNKIDLE